jgi:hypothetical protein
VGVISNILQQRRIVAVLANSPSFTHNSQISGFGGNHVCCPVEEIPVQFVARSGADIPDVDRVTAGMVRKQDQLSPGCQVYFRPSEPEPAVRASAPLNIKPSASRKPVSDLPAMV